MERGDIAPFERPSRACMFEGLLASPPKKHRLLIKRQEEDRTLRGWTPHEIPLKSLVYQTNNLGLHIAVFTLLGSDMEDPVYRWLTNRGARATVYAYDGIAELVEVLRYNQQFKTVYVPTKDLWQTIGMRATVVSPTAELGGSVGVK